MLIVCPKCTTSYRIVEAAIGSSGRSVHCVRCDHQWRIELPSGQAASAIGRRGGEEAQFRAELGKPDSEESPAIPAPVESSGEPAGAPPEETSPDEAASPATAAIVRDEPASDAIAKSIDEPAPAALADIPIPVANAPSIVPATAESASAAPQFDNRGDIETVAARRARTAARRRGHRSKFPLSFAIAVMLVIAGALLGLRKDVVRRVPQLASLYASIGLPVNLRGLDFTDIRIGSEIHDGVPVLVVEGAIISKASMAVDVPRLRFAVRDASGGELYSWTAQPPQPVLEPGKRLSFRSRLASPPGESHDVQVRFFTHQDAVAGLR